MTTKCLLMQGRKIAFVSDHSHLRISYKRFVDLMSILRKMCIFANS